MRSHHFRKEKRNISRKYTIRYMSNQTEVLRNFHICQTAPVRKYKRWAKVELLDIQITKRKMYLT